MAVGVWQWLHSGLISHGKALAPPPAKSEMPTQLDLGVARAALWTAEASRLSNENNRMRDEIQALQESARAQESVIEIQRINNTQLELDIKDLGRQIESLNERLNDTEDSKVSPTPVD